MRNGNSTSEYVYKAPVRRLFRLAFVNIAALLFGIPLSLLIASQYTAHKLDYSPILGRPLIGKLYNPFQFLRWQFNIQDYPGARDIFLRASLLFILSISCVLFSLCIVRVVHRSRYESTEIHGSSRFATEEEIRKIGLLDNSTEGIFLGAWSCSGRNKSRYLKYSGDKHVLGVAPTRTGKGVGLVIPTLLSWPQSVLVHDIKGENWALTSAWRRDGLDNVVIKFDPTCDDGSSACFNPLLEIRIGPKEVRDTQNIVEMIIDPDGKGHFFRDHWRKSAHTLLVGCILHVLYRERDKTLRGVARLLSDPETGVADVLKAMLATCHDPEGTHRWIDTGTGKPTRTHPVVSATARDMLNKAHEERSGIISTALSFLSLFRDPIIAANTETSHFFISDLMNHDKPVSLYLVVPPSDIPRTRPLVRLVLNQIATRLLEKMEFSNGVVVPCYKHQLLLMLDEFPSLGKLESFQTALAYMASYGLQAYLIAQDMSQIYGAYGHDEAIVSNCHIRIAFAPNKLETAELISRMTGTKTVPKLTKNFSGKRANLALENVSDGVNEIQRNLLTADEVLTLPEDNELIFVSNTPPIYANKIRHYTDPVFDARSKMPAPARSDIIRSLPNIAFPDFDDADYSELPKGQADESAVDLDPLYDVNEYDDDAMLI